MLMQNTLFDAVCCTLFNSVNDYYYWYNINNIIRIAQRQTQLDVWCELPNLLSRRRRLAAWPRPWRSCSRRDPTTSPTSSRRNSPHLVLVLVLVVVVLRNNARRSLICRIWRHAVQRSTMLWLGEQQRKTLVVTCQRTRCKITRRDWHSIFCWFHDDVELQTTHTTFHCCSTYCSTLRRRYYRPL